MSAADLTPPASGTATPTAASLTKAGIAKNLSSDTGKAPLDASLLKTTMTTAPRTPPQPGSEELKAVSKPKVPTSWPSLYIMYGPIGIAVQDGASVGIIANMRLAMDFMRACTDHMITARWTLENGWEAPELKAYGPLQLMPTASVLHYATECFEGLKLYHGYDGTLRLFRVGRNCERMRRSAARISLPDFDAEQLETLIKKLCAVDGPKWLPQKGGFLYLRPTFIATDPYLGVQVPKEALLYVIMACFPDWSDPRNLPPASVVNPDLSLAVREAQGLKLLASKEDAIRAWPGGFGFAKLGANYGPSLVGQGEARSRGYDQILWLFGPKADVTEAGASNFFVVWRTTEGRLQLVTAPLGDNLILEGVTRASVLQLARERLTKSTADVEALEVVERKFTMQEVADAVTEGRMIEAFAAGTAYFVAPVGLIGWKEHEFMIPLAEGKTGVYARMVRGWLSDIMHGKEQHEWGVVIEKA